MTKSNELKSGIESYRRTWSRFDGLTVSAQTGTRPHLRETGIFSCGECEPTITTTGGRRFRVRDLGSIRVEVDCASPNISAAERKTFVAAMRSRIETLFTTNERTIYVTICKLDRGSYFGRPGHPEDTWNDFQVSVPDKSPSSFDFARQIVTTTFCEAKQCTEAQVRIIGAF